MGVPPHREKEDRLTEEQAASQFATTRPSFLAKKDDRIRAEELV